LCFVISLGSDKRFENLRNCVPHTLLKISSSMVGLKSYGVTFNIYLLSLNLNLLELDQIVLKCTNNALVYIVKIWIP
jgi:hypothetical protein